jgi:hypothetical protein
MPIDIKNNPVSNFSRGFFYPFRAAKFIKNHPPLLKYVIIPFLINVILLSLAVYWGFYFFSEIVVNYIPQGDAWYWLILGYFLWTVAVLVTMVLVFFCFTVSGSLIASPFNDLLSEKTEELLTGILNEEPFIIKVFLKDAIQTMMDESKKIIIFIVLMIMLLFLNLLPGGPAAGWHPALFCSVNPADCLFPGHRVHRLCILPQTPYFQRPTAFYLFTKVPHAGLRCRCYGCADHPLFPVFLHPARGRRSNLPVP